MVTRDKRGGGGGGGAPGYYVITAIAGGSYATDNMVTIAMKLLQVGGREGTR